MHSDRRQCRNASDVERARFPVAQPCRAIRVSSLMKLLFLLLFATAISAAELKDIPYLPGGDPLHKLDLYLPENSTGAQAVVIGIHGGGWAIGDKSNRTFVQPKAQWFNQHGILFASINYRLSPAVQHPAHVEDVCAAIAWIQKNIASHGGDPRQLYLLGHSAGAHLAALAAIDHPRLKHAGADPKRLRGVILLDGAGYDIPSQMRTGTPLARVNGMYADAFTLDPKVQRDASPTLKVDRKPPPFLILHVKHRADSKAQSEGLARALTAKGGTATVVPAFGKTHMSINRDFGRPGDVTTNAAARFLGLPVDEPDPRSKLRNGPASK